MKINLYCVGMFQTNCYIIETNNKNAMIIDAGDSAEGIMDFCEKKDLQIKMLVFTHGHFDHIMATSKIKEKTNAKTYIHKDDLDLFLDPKKGMSGFPLDFSVYHGEQPDVSFEDGDIISLDDITLKVMHTPGHTKGSSILIGDDVIFTGDTLFKGSIGRTDLFGGNQHEILQSLEKISQIKGEYTILAGHGDSSKLSVEKITNPYMGKNYDDIF